jgi:hypothetical protein
MMKADRSTNLPLPPVEMNARTGMIGYPRATNQGIPRGNALSLSAVHLL